MTLNYFYKKTNSLNFNNLPNSLSYSENLKEKQYTKFNFLKLLAQLFFVLFFIGNTTVAQTLLIDPAGDGGFETGTTFAANGWTADTGSTRNWYVGTGQTGYTGNRCAFIGNNATTVGTNSSARTVHLYRSITIPAGATNIQLSFKYKQAVSDFINPTYYDYITVYTNNTAPSSGSFPGGALQFGPYPNVNVLSFTTQNITLPNTLSGTTTNLIFTFRSDNFNPEGYGAIDDVSLTFTPPPPTITSLGSTSGCVGSSITINGTNLGGATTANVKIGGTAVTAITSNTGTAIVATIGTGTTGTVSVTTSGGTATSSATFTVNPLPIITSQPAATSICTTGSGTFTVTTTGATTFQWRRNGVNLTNIAPYNNTTTATLSITNPVAGDAGTFDVIVGNATSCTVTSSAAALTVIARPSITTNPSNVAIAAGANTSFTAVASNTPTSYIWEVSTDGGSIWSTISNVGVYTNATTATLNITSATIGMNNYKYRVSATNSCGTSVPSASAALTVTLSYCTSTGGTFANGIKGVVFNTISNLGTAVNVTYSDYTAISTTVTKGNSYNISIYLNTGGNYKDYQSVWIDWNANGVFTDPGEFYNLGLAENVTNGLSSASPYSISVPVGAATASVRMRIQSKYNGTTTSSCDTGFDGEVEDYTVNIIAPPACVTPTAQPTALSLTPTINAIAGSFALATPTVDNYLVVINSTGITPTLTDGTNYTIGSTILGGTNVIVDNDTNANFTASGLTASTLYYLYVFSMNTLCTGGPKYLTSSPLNGNATTLTFCSSSSTSNTYYISSFKTTGAIVDAPINNTGYSATGYANYTANTPAEQIAGAGVNISLTLGGGIQYVKVWVDWNKNNVFDDATELTFSSSTAFVSNTFGFVVPAGTAVGDYKMRIRSKKTDSSFTSCNSEPDGETEDYTIRVIQDCTAKITSTATVERCGEGAVTLIVTGTAPTTSYKWYDAETGSAISGAIGNSYTTPSLSITKTYYVTALNGTCESLIRKPIIAKIKPIPNITITPENPEICGEKTLLEISAAGSNEVVDLFSENFEGTGLGGFTKINLANGSSTTEWQQKTSVYSTTTVVWKPAISSGDSGNKFAFTTSDVGGSGKSLVMVTTNNINTTSFTDLTLSFRQYFSYYGSGDSAIIEVSTDGTSWTPVQTYTSNQGSPGKFALVSIPLNAYIGSTTLKFRFKYNAGFCDGWAIDDVLLYGTRPLTSSITWTGATIDAYIDAATTIPYTNQLVNTVYIKPSAAQLEVASWSFNANVQLTNGCSATKAVSVTNTSKIWQGLSANWNDPNNWKPSGVPTSANCVVIPNNSIISGSDYNAYAKNLTVKSTGNLELLSSNNITVADWVNVNIGGIFNVRNNASLVQTNNTTNTGIVNVERITPPISELDYTYWSSPVSGFTLGQFSTANSYMYSYIPTVSNGSGDWQPESNATIMSPAKGYIIRTPWGHIDGSTYKATFIGIPNNGDILTPISKGTLIGVVDVDAEDDEWNLIGNPYPSGLDIAKFIDLPANIPVIDGTVYIWTHNSPPSTAAPDPFYGDYAYNYTSEDYATVNKTGATVTATAATTGGGAPSEFIASGQSFFIKTAASMANGTTANATFTNSMRVTGKNSSFSKTKTSKEAEKSRIWLNLTNNSGAFSQILVGYLANATQGLDRGFDGENLGGNDVTFYSIIPEARLTIQGRALPFEQNDEVVLGYNSAINGALSIRIDHTDGLINTQKIYLEDKQLNTIHNLREKPYVFDTEEGDFNDRFVLRYRQSDKDSGTNTSDDSYGVKVIVNQKVTIQSFDELIKNVTVYDMSGRKIDNYKNVDSFNYSLNNLFKTTGGLILKIQLENDAVVTKKIIF